METKKRKLGKYLVALSSKRDKSVFERLLVWAYVLYKRVKGVFRQSKDPTIGGLYLKYKNVERTMLSDRYTFVRVDELTRWIDEWIKELPTSYDVIVGVPRSGLFVASLMALRLGKPLTTPDLYGEVLWASEHIKKPDVVRRVLLIDDSATTGETLRKNHSLLKEKTGDEIIETGVVIASEDTEDVADYYYAVVHRPRLFEWNFMHSKKGVTAIDMDGILCENPPTGLDMFENEYRAWIRGAKPYLIPAFEVDAIVSNRLEQYRAETEQWLHDNGVRYKNLLLCDASRQEREENKTKHKTDTLLQLKPDIFWESHAGEGREIWKKTKIPTLCIDEKIIFD